MDKAVELIKSGEESGVSAVQTATELPMDYVEKKLRQLEERKLRRAQRRSQRADEREQEALRAEEAERQRMEAFRNAPLKVGEKVRIKESGGGITLSGGEMLAQPAFSTELLKAR